MKAFLVFVALVVVGAIVWTGRVKARADAPYDSPEEVVAAASAAIPGLLGKYFAAAYKFERAEVVHEAGDTYAYTVEYVLREPLYVAIGGDAQYRESPFSGHGTLRDLQELTKQSFPLLVAAPVGAKGRMVGKLAAPKRRRDPIEIGTPTPLEFPNASPRSGFAGTAYYVVEDVPALLARLDSHLGLKRKEVDRLFREVLVPALHAYRRDMGTYPASGQLDAGLRSPPPGPQGARWKGPYLKSEVRLIDPWGTLYQYRFPGARNPAAFELWSVGPDRLSDADDIRN